MNLFLSIYRGNNLEGGNDSVSFAKWSVVMTKVPHSDDLLPLGKRQLLILTNK